MEHTRIKSQVPDERTRVCNRRPVRGGGDFVLYWMTAFRRTESNFALQRAVDWATELGRPLVVLETLECDSRWATARRHRFVLGGMKDTASRLLHTNVFYYPYVEPKPGFGQALLNRLSQDASVVIGDDFPCRANQRQAIAVAEQLPSCLELVDSNGLLPMRAAGKVFKRAVDFRRFLQKSLRPYLLEFPDPDPLDRADLTKLTSLPEGVIPRWPMTDVRSFANCARGLESIPIDHTVDATALRGGSAAGQAVLHEFVEERSAGYDDNRNKVEADGTSRLSPYLHFGHISAHQVFLELMNCAGWSPARLANKSTGSARGWWGAPDPVDSFLDQLITWRELGFNMCSHRDDYDQYESLPDWSRATLDAHSGDARDYVYSLSQFESAETHDPLWNAAQTQLVREGRIHNYLRMLWGKKILEWSEGPRHALEIMIELNNKYALDGCDPNSYSGIFWVLGRYDRAWGPERPIFGKVRYLSSENAARKMRVKGYLERYASGAGVATAGA